MLDGAAPMVNRTVIKGMATFDTMSCSDGQYFDVINYWSDGTIFTHNTHYCQLLYRVARGEEIVFDSNCPEEVVRRFWSYLDRDIREHRIENLKYPRSVRFQAWIRRILGKVDCYD